MGGCQSKKTAKPNLPNKKVPGETKGGKTKGSANTTSTTSANQKVQEPKNEELKAPSSTSQKGSPGAQSNQTPSVNKESQEKHLQLLYACYEGNLEQVLDLCEQLQLKDISTIKGHKTQVTLGEGIAKKKYESTAEWNPLLLAISQKHLNIVTAIFQRVTSFHKINCISKPYDIETQKQTIYDHNKRLKRECFGLKLAILNKDDQMLKFLWTENKILWNLGHFFLSMQIIMKNNWEQGLKILISSSTTKILLMSVNNVDDFIDTVDLIKDEMKVYELINRELCSKLQQFFLNRPYFIYCFFLEIDIQQEKSNIEFLQHCLDSLKQDDIPFKHTEIDEIFSLLDPNNALVAIRDRYFAKFENRDQDIEDLQREIIRVFENDKSKDSEQYVTILEELDLFAFSQLQIRGEPSNCLMESLSRGFEIMIDYIFSEGFTNIRSHFKKNNKYETENDVAQFDVKFFIKHQHNFHFFTKIYYSLIDLMQLSNFLEIFTEVQNNKVYELILNDPKFISLFESSLELQKFIFMRELLQVAEAQPQKPILKIIQNQNPYKTYYQQIKRGNSGEVFAEKTITHLQQLALTREQQLQENNNKGGKANAVQAAQFIKQNEQNIKNMQKLVLTDKPIFGQKRNEIAMRNSLLVMRSNLAAPLANQQQQQENLYLLKNNIGMKVSPAMRKTLGLQQPIQMRNTLGLYHAMAMRKTQGPNQTASMSGSQSASPIRNGGDGQQVEVKELHMKNLIQQKKKQQITKHETIKEEPSPKNHESSEEIDPGIITTRQEDQQKEIFPQVQTFQMQDEETFAAEKTIANNHDKQKVGNLFYFGSSQVSEVAAVNTNKNNQQNQIQPSNSLLKELDETPRLSQENNQQLQNQSTHQDKGKMWKQKNSDDEDNGELGEDPADLLINQSQRMPYKASTRRDMQNTSDMPELYDPIKAKESFEQLPSLLIDCIKSNNIAQIQYLLKSFNIRNVTWLKHFDAERLLVKGSSYFDSRYSTPGLRISQNQPKQQAEYYYQTSLWNPVHFAIYYQRVDILRVLMNEYAINFIMAMRLPPVNEFTEYIIPNNSATAGNTLAGGKSQNNDQWTNSKQINRQNIDDSRGSASADHLINSPCQQFDVPWMGYTSDSRINPNPTPSPQPHYYYNPSDARIECFGIELAIRNRDLATLTFLWSEQPEKWEERHFAFFFDKMLQERWEQGLEFVFRSKTSHRIFQALNPEDKDNFLYSKIVDKLTDTEFWENAQSPIKLTDRQIQLVMQELQCMPYGGFAVLKFPQLFEKYGLLEAAISKVSFDDIYDFAIARKENVVHLQTFVMKYNQQTPNSDRSDVQSQQKCLKTLNNILKKAAQATTDQRKLPPNPEKVVQLIKLGDLESLKRFFQKDDNIMLLELLNQMQGYEDSDYPKMCQSQVKSVPADDTIQLLLEDGTTYDWNPLIYAIFYQKKEIVEFFCEHRLVYVRNCLTAPFIIEQNFDEIDNDADEEKFIKEKSELFCLVLTIMTQNREIFRYLLKRCSYLWNDIHLVILANYIFDAQWHDGIKVLFTSVGTHQTFNAMNLYEKEKFLKFCDKSVSRTNNEQLIKDFRYQMAFDPYNIYYLPILAQPEEIRYWDQEQSKELFLKNCQLNFDERAFSMLSKYNNHYVTEFISTAITAESDVLINFARKLKRYMRKEQQPPTLL